MQLRGYKGVIISKENIREIKLTWQGFEESSVYGIELRQGLKTDVWLHPNCRSTLISRML